MKKQPKPYTKEQIAKMALFEEKLKKFKFSHGYCAENATCLNRLPKGRWGCDECLADADPRR